MYTTNMLSIFLVLIVKTQDSSAFLFGSECFSPSPCTCSTNYIRCDHKHLSQIPSFTGHYEHYSNLYVDLVGNQLTTIPQDAFRNLSSINATSISLELYLNRINQIDDHAFDGIENTITSLDLQNNNLSSLPSALKELTALQRLDVKANPLTSLDTTVLSILGNSLVRFSFTADHLSAFPSNLHYLKHLRDLTIWYIQHPFLQANVFCGLEASLTILDLSGSKLETIPSAVCSLTNLQTFSFSTSSNLRNTSLFDECHFRMASLTYLTLDYNNLAKFPLISTFAPHLQNLRLVDNNLKQIDSNSLTSILSLTYLNLDSNHLPRIPSALNKLTNLDTLYIGHNQITSIEEYDLLQLHRLKNINLNGNPLTYISPTSFIHSPLLYSIQLDYTHLSQIPKAVTGLAHLSNLYLDHVEPQCSCDKMLYLKSWNVSALYISGDCSSGVNIKTYLATLLPKCT